MNLTGAKAALTKNRVGLGVLGAAAVAAVAWRARSKSAATTSTATTPLAATTAPAGYAAGGQTASATGYDSTGSDVYNAIQPQLEALSSMMREATAPPIPVPAAPAKSLGYASHVGSPTQPLNGYFEIFDNGTSRQFTGAEIALSGMDFPKVHLTDADFAPYAKPYAG